MINRVRSKTGVQANEEDGQDAPDAWREWLEALFPAYVGAFAGRHERFWEWAWAIGPQDNPRPYVGIWPRGDGKSTSAELATCALGLRERSRYAVYVRRTQDLADDSVSNVQSMLESNAVERYYPSHAEPEVGKFGNVRGWRRERLQTAGGFTVDALGLDAAARGAKIDDARPDLIILDDIDEKHDSRAATQKKLTTLKDSVLGLLSDDGSAVIAIQNLVLPNGVFARLADGRADFLQLRTWKRQNRKIPRPGSTGTSSYREQRRGRGRICPIARRESTAVGLPHSSESVRTTSRSERARCGLRNA